MLRLVLPVGPYLDVEEQVDAGKNLRILLMVILVNGPFMIRLKEPGFSRPFPISIVRELVFGVGAVVGILH